MPIHLFESYHKSSGLNFPCRSVLVKERDKVILISPISFSADQIQQIRSFGEVTDLVAPCLFHHLAMLKAIETFPKAKVWGVPGFEQKRADIPWSNPLTVDAWPYKDFLDIVAIDGIPKMNEVEFFHKVTRTLITTDLCFNLRKPPGLVAAVILRMAGTYNEFAVSRLIKMMVKDKPAFEESLVRLFHWDFDRIVMSHGKVLESGGKEVLRKALNARGFAI